MAAIGGPIQDVSIDGRLFSVAADADSGRKYGGFENEIEPNGDETVRIIKSRVPWMIDGLSLAYDDNQADLEFLQAVADSAEPVDITVTYVSGVTVEASGTIVGELKGSSKNATVPVTLGGGGKLGQQ